MQFRQERSFTFLLTECLLAVFSVPHLRFVCERVAVGRKIITYGSQPLVRQTLLRAVSFNPNAAPGQAHRICYCNRVYAHSHYFSQNFN